MKNEKEGPVFSVHGTIIRRTGDCDMLANQNTATVAALQSIFKVLMNNSPLNTNSRTPDHLCYTVGLKMSKI
jgi:hypothetical protein